MLCPYVDTAWTDDEAGHIQSRRRVFPRNTGAVHGASGATAWSCVVNNAAIYNGSGPCSDAMCTAVCAKLERTSCVESGGTTRGATFKNGTAGIVQSSKVHRFEGALHALCVRLSVVAWDSVGSQVLAAHCAI